jgi:anthranilate phosphoribosyltransferase
MISDAIKKLIDNKDLSASESREVTEEIMSGTASPVLAAVYLTALRQKGETAEEILGAAKVMRERVSPVKHHQDVVFDNCGTGGDGAGTFNISTTTSFVIAACGLHVAKHGNRSVSSQCGSADLLAALGADLTLTPDQIGECIDVIGIGFLFAPNLHPAMKAVMPVRKELGFRTIFNLLGPLTNPAFATHQLIGVFSGEYTDKLADVGRGLGIKRTMVVYNLCNTDEITTAGITKISLADNGSTENYELNPEEYGFSLCNIADLQGGDAQLNAAITNSILKGEKGPKRDTVILNAAAALTVAEKVESIDKGIAVATESIDTGAAMEKLQRFIQFTRDRSNVK